MAAKKKTKTHSKVQETTFRHLWLAGLGAIAVARRETRNAANDAVAKVESLKQQAGKLANDAQANVRAASPACASRAKPRPASSARM